MLGLSLVLLALWLACEICARDFASPPPPDPFRKHRWRNGGPP